MGAGTIFGELGFYRETVSTATVVTDRRSSIYRLSRPALQRMEEENPELVTTLHAFVVRLVAERLVYANETIDRLLR